MSASSDNQNNQTNSGWQSTLAAPFQFILGFAISLFLIAGVGYASTWMTEGRCAICATDADTQNQESKPEADNSNPEPEPEPEPEPDSAEEPQNDEESDQISPQQAKPDETQEQEPESAGDSDANGEDSE